MPALRVRQDSALSNPIALLFDGIGEVGPGMWLILLEGQDHACQRDNVIGVHDGLSHAASVHEYSPGGLQVSQDEVSLDGAYLGVMAGDARVIDYEVVIQHAPNIGHGPIEGKDLPAFHEKESVGREAIVFFIHR